MKAKNIARHLSGKVSDWLESIEDARVKKLASEGTIVTGGCIASLLLGERVNDYDLYFKDKETVLALANYYVGRFKKNPPIRFKESGEPVSIKVVETETGRIKIVVQSAGIAGEENEEYAYFELDPDPMGEARARFIETAFEVATEETGEDDELPRYRPVLISANAITLSDKVQLCLRFYGKPKEIHANHDFIHATNYWCSWTGHVTLRKDALESLLTKELRVVSGGTLYPIAALCRVRKFLNRGFHIVAGQLLKLCFAVNELDFNDYEVLEDQLTGVDYAYFQELLQYLSQHKDEWEGGKALTPYILELIDKLL